MWLVLSPFQRWRGATRDAGEASEDEKPGELPSPRRCGFALDDPVFEVVILADLWNRRRGTEG